MIREALPLGVRALDTLVPCGRGQRMGIFAGSGVGKSTLLSMITRGTEASVTVLALVGERGREVREFIENDLGPEGLARAVVVVATSDEPALVRLRAAFTATRIAESFRDEGHDVLLLMDSLTRFAMAQREVGLSAGEPPATRGYPPSVFAMLPRLLERAGASDVGSITGLYTVLVEGDDMLDPIGDATRAILDGHIVLSRALATVGSLPVDRRARVDLPRRARGHDAPNSARPRPRCGGCSPRTAKRRTSSKSARTCRAPTRSSTAPSNSEKQWTASSDRTCTRRRPHTDAWAWLERLVGGAARMKRFRFRLDQVLHVRRVQEDQARAELLSANRDAHLAAARVDERLADYARRAAARSARSRTTTSSAPCSCSTPRAGAVGVARARRTATRSTSSTTGAPTGPTPAAGSPRWNDSKNAAAPSTRSKCSAPKTNSSTTSSSPATPEEYRA